ncbi:unnamed protein product [Diatraea saccharalis]|uniref:LIM zinc-binding domain-containing protein n=1 Tax=Diatraea saccharalis TaxID=40085 RepID=A0A9N9RE81_9NEOP|nr:unnamed protein product [Diatraea saccharalis]
MNKTCARCEKTVYPTEELKCLDKVWHKGCFKCQECGMTLNMRTYKGYGKLPYCEAHVPKAKHTTMAETPELKRIAENTKIQSNVKYHADFEKSKGKFTQVADDPETLRIKANTKIISNVAYHGDLEKKAQMEKQRQMNENGELVDLPSDNYHQQIENYASEMLPSSVPPPHLPPKNHYQTPNTQYQTQNTQYPPQNSQYQPQNSQYQQQNSHYQQNTQYQGHTQQVQNAQHHVQNTHDAVQNTQHRVQNTQHQAQNTQHLAQNAQHIAQNAQHQTQNAQHPTQNTQYQQYPSQNYQQERYSGDQYKKYDDYQYQYEYQNQNQYQGQYQGNQYYGAGGQPKIGRIQDYDPVSDGPRAPPNTQRASATLIYNSTSDGKRGSQTGGQQSSRQIGRVTDLDPLATEQAKPNHTSQNVYIAMYDYEATDSDEVSFREGDYICNVSCIDEGWMTGQVLRTGRTGMLPANYVERVNARV